LSNIERDGFAVLSGVLNEDSRLQLIRDIEECLVESRAGIRGLVAKVPSVAVLARSEVVRSLVEPVLGVRAKLVRAILFNKSPDAKKTRRVIHLEFASGALPAPLAWAEEAV
jgi:hypothetical protein